MSEEYEEIRNLRIAEVVAARCERPFAAGLDQTKYLVLHDRQLPVEGAGSGNHFSEAS